MQEPLSPCDSHRRAAQRVRQRHPKAFSAAVKYSTGVLPSSPFRTAGTRNARGGPQETEPASQHTPLADGTRRRRRSRARPARHAPARLQSIMMRSK
ncbi:hypothetical protein OEZ86_004317 [Tetradesmus obliquus]|nr:hypothetical protein OEZ86_004317 [Tetradesmus obliquus]